MGVYSGAQAHISVSERDANWDRGSWGPLRLLVVGLEWGAGGTRGDKTPVGFRSDNFLIYIAKTLINSSNTCFTLIVEFIAKGLLEKYDLTVFLVYR